MEDYPVLDVGLDNIYRLSTGDPFGQVLLRGRWADDQTFIIDYPYPAAGGTVLGELGETEFRFAFEGDELEITVQQLVFGGEPLIIKGSR